MRSAGAQVRCLKAPGTDTVCLQDSSLSLANRQQTKPSPQHAHARPYAPPLFLPTAQRSPGTACTHPARVQVPSCALYCQMPRCLASRPARSTPPTASSVWGVAATAHWKSSPTGLGRGLQAEEGCGQKEQGVGTHDGSGRSGRQGCCLAGAASGPCRREAQPGMGTRRAL